MKKQILVSTIAAAVAATAFVPAAQAADLSASAGVSNFYLWRGQDLSDGSPAIWGDLSASEGPVYGGIWASSGDDSYGQEYDLYVGVGHAFNDDFSVDLSYWTYSYPDTAVGVDVGPGEIADVILTAGLGPVSVSGYVNVGDNYVPFDIDSNTGLAKSEPESEIYFLTASAGYMDFSGTLGHFISGADASTNLSRDGYTYLDLGYGYNDSLGFTVTLPLAQDEDKAGDLNDDPMFNVSYTLPIDL